MSSRPFNISDIKNNYNPAIEYYLSLEYDDQAEAYSAANCWGKKTSEEHSLMDCGLDNFVDEKTFRKLSFLLDDADIRIP
jgi:hypothetical protein